MQATNNTIHILSVGAFGRAIATSLQELLPGVIETRIELNGQTHPMLWPTAKVHVLASWRPVTKLSRLLDEMCHAWRTPFIEAVQETPMLRVGPVVVPGQGACYGCYETRTLQHVQRALEYKALRDFYNLQPRQGPQGYLPAIADLAAIRIAQFVRELEHDAATVAGQVWQLNTIHRDTMNATIVGVHACPRCGLGQEEQTRSFVALRGALDWMFAAQAAA